jgi:hypothetical protein
LESAAKATLILAPAKVTKTSRTTPKPTVSEREVRIFVSYSHVDSAVRDKLEVHLAALKRDGVVTWYDGDMRAGDALDTEIARALRQSHLFVALLSPDYLASHYCWKLEYQRAMGRRARGTLRVIAVVVRPCDWKATAAAGFKLLPTDGKPVSRWRSQDQALLDVTQGIRKVVQAIRKEASAQEELAPRVRAAKVGGPAGAPARAKRGSAPARKRTVRTPTKIKR